jgi:hypothetical protein
MEPAKKNQRIGRIDRLGQRSKKLTVINFIGRNSIEERIATGLGLKQNLFDGVLSESNRLDVVDFSAGGRAQFLAELELAMNEMLHQQPFEEPEVVEENSVTEQPAEEDIINIVKEEEPEEQPAEIVATADEKTNEANSPQQVRQMEEVMQNGINFLEGLYQMATGKSMAPEEQKISIDPQTGEVVMRFKIPIS